MKTKLRSLKKFHRRYLMTAESATGFKILGKELGDDGFPDESMVAKNLKTPEGVFSMWDTDHRTLKDVKRIARSLLEAGHIVYIYCEVSRNTFRRVMDIYMRDRISEIQNMQHHHGGSCESQ